MSLSEAFLDMSPLLSLANKAPNFFELSSISRFLAGFARDPPKACDVSAGRLHRTHSGSRNSKIINRSKSSRILGWCNNWRHIIDLRWVGTIGTRQIGTGREARELKELELEQTFLVVGHLAGEPVGLYPGPVCNCELSEAVDFNVSTSAKREKHYKNRNKNCSNLVELSEQCDLVRSSVQETNAQSPETLSTPSLLLIAPGLLKFQHTSQQVCIQKH
nr:hypothetical protein Iba_chr12aCG2780 [Ipomoea batatas]